MNIVFGKLGKKFYFSTKKWAIDSGDSEVASLLITLSTKHPEMNFYIIGKSDFSELSDNVRNKYFPNNNVYDVWEDFKTKSHDRTEWVNDYFNKRNIKIDFGYIHAGPISAVNVPEKSYLLKEKSIYKVLTMHQNYSAPLVHFLNTSKVPWVTLGEDPRFLPMNSRDMFNRPIKYYSTYNKDYNVKVNDGYLNMNTHTEVDKLRCIWYDRWFLVSEDKTKLADINNYTKTNLLSIYTNGNGTTGQKKYKIIEEYLFNNNIDSKIYGKWNEKIVGNDDRFINTPMSELTEQMYKTKYTLMFHFQDGFPSSKFWKMIFFGIIPFYHKNMDTQKNQPVHPFCRINSPNELNEKINTLENDQDLYKEIMIYHLSQFKDEYFNGKFVDKIFIKSLNKLCNTNLHFSNRNDFYKESVLFNNTKGKTNEYKLSVNL